MELPESVVEGSSLTSVQVESLVAYMRVASHEMTLKQAAESRRSGPVKLGSFYRTVQQGRKNVKASILTVVIAMWVGLIKPDELLRLFNQMGRGLPELEDAEVERIAVVIKALLERIVT